MVKKELVEQGAEGNWTNVLGLGALGVAMSLGIGPVLAILFGLMAVGLITTIYLLPVVLGIAVGATTWYLSGVAELKGSNRLIATLGALFGSLLIFSFTDVTLWSMGMSSAYSSANVQSIIGAIGTLTKLFQLLLGLVFTGFVLLAMMMYRAVGNDAFADITVGILSALFAGLMISSFFDIRVPGLSTGASQSLSGIIPVAVISGIVGIIALYVSFKE